MTTKIIVTFFLLVISTWTTKSEEIKGNKTNFQMNNKTFSKFEVNTIKKSVKVPQLVIKISRLIVRVSSLNIFSGVWNLYNCWCFLNVFINNLERNNIWKIRHSFEKYGNFISWNCFDTTININCGIRHTQISISTVKKFWIFFFFLVNIEK